MLEMKQNCETCEAPLGSEGEAFICSFECTFCEPCTRNVHKMTCPNCGGDLVRRPKRRAKED
ncbi:MAG: DUF1272 domain-containing protein [Sphingomonadales bacterium]